MKQKRLFTFLCMLMALVYAVPTHADELTVCDGSTTVTKMPYYGLNGDYYQHNQMIYPASMLSDMDGGVINGMTFFISSSSIPAVAWTSNFEITLSEVSGETFATASYLPITRGTLVFIGGPLDGTSGLLEIEFDTPFSYAGGNLLIDFADKTSGNYKSASFLGVSASGAALYGEKSPSYGTFNDIVPTMYDYLPKVMFDYTPGTPATCPKPGKLVASEIGENSAMLSWSKGGEESSWEVVCGDQTFVVSDTFQLVEGLTSNMAYEASVRAICGVGDSSNLSKASFRTACGTEVLPFSEDFNSLSAGIPACWDNSEGTTTSDSYKWNYYSEGQTGACLRFDSYFNAKGNTNFLATPAIFLSEDAELLFDFQYGGSGDLSVYVSESGSSEKALLLGGLNQQFSWEREYVDLSAYTGKTVVLYFKGTSDYGSYKMDIDNILVRKQPSCKKVSNIRIDNIGVNSADILWDVNGVESDWSVFAIQGSDTLFNGSVSGEAKATLALESGTRYTLNVWVVADCGDEKSDTVRSVLKFDSGCEAWIPVNDSVIVNNEIYTSGVLPPCFGNIPCGAFVWKIGDYNAHTGSKNFEAPGLPSDTDKVGMILPLMELPEDAEISFWMREHGSHRESDSLTVWVNSEPSMEGAEWLLTAKPQSSTDEFFRAPIPADYRTGCYIILMYHGYFSSHVDDILISPAPMCLPVTHLELADVTLEHAAFTWQHGGDEEAWVYSYSFFTVDGGDTLWIEGEEQETDVDTIFIGDDLEEYLPASTYQGELTVWANCDDWSEPATAEFTFFTPCVPFDLPYVEDFESFEKGSSSSPAPGCWSMLNANEGNYPYMYINDNSTYVRSGTKSLYFMSSSSKYAYAILPAFTEPLNMLQIAFSHKEEDASSSGKTTVGYMTDITDESTFVPVYECGRLTKVWQDEIVSLGAIPEEVASTARLVLRYGGASNNYYLGIDNLRVEVMPDCAKPTNLRAGIVTSSSAEILWNPGAKEKEWKLLVKHGTDTLYNDSIKDVSAFVVEDLEANTDYTFAVEVMACGEDTLRGSVSLTTLCNSMSREEIPYSMDFEDATADAMPDCWNAINYVPSSSSYPCVRAYSSSSYEGSKYLYFYGNGSAAQENFAILPEMDMPLDSLNIKFMYKASSSTYSVYPKVIVGVMSNPADKSTFIGLDTLPYAADYTEYDLDIPAVPEECHFIAIEYGTGNSSNGAYIDNLVISKQMACKKARNIHVERVGLHDAVIAWDGLSEKYIVTLKEGDHSTKTEVEADSIVLSELPSSSMFTYLVTVQGVCDADSSEVVAAELSFVTECDFVVIDSEHSFAQDFNALTAGIPNCWDNSETSVTTASYNWNYLASGYEGACVRFDSWINSTGVYGVLKTPAFVLHTAADLSFMCKNPQGGDYSVYAEKNDGTTVPLLSGLTGISDWTKETADLSALEGDTIVICFKGISNYGNSQTGNVLYLDDVRVREIPTCFPGSNVHLIDSTVTLTSATIEWNKEEGQTEWQVVLLNGVDTFRNVTVDDTVYTIEGLSHSTNYNLNAFVYTVCNGALSPDAAMATLSFATKCQVIDALPWSQDFEGVKANTAPVCWDMLTLTGDDNTSIYVSKETTHAFDAQSLKFQKGGYAVLPEMDVDFAGKQIVFSYQHEGDQSGEFEFGYITDIADVATFVPMIQLEKSIAWNERFSVALDTVPAGARLAFHYIYAYSSWFMFVDNIIVRETPMCDVPMHLQVGEVTAHTVALNWKAGAKETAWDVLVTRGSDTIVETSVDTTFYMIEGLEANKQDTLEVNIIACGTDTLTKSVVFKTLCDPMPAEELPLSEDFENAISYPDCWYRIYGNPTAYTVYPYVATSATSSHLGSKYLTFYDYYVQYAILPEQTVDLNTLMLSFYYKNYSTYSSYGQFIVGAMSDPSDESTFVPLDTLDRKTSYTYYELSLSNVPEDCHFVAIMLTEGSYGYNAYIDDLMLRKQPTCKRVTDLALFAAGENDATFTWTAGGSESQWQVVLNDGTNTITDTVETPMYVMSGLTPMTKYHCSLGITALCGDGDVADANSADFSFATAMPASYVQSLVKDEAFIPNFADADERAKWMIEGADQPNHFIIGHDPAALETEAAALYVSDGDSAWHYTVGTSAASFATRRFSVANDSAVIAVSFDWQAMGDLYYSSPYDFGRALIIPASASREIASSVIKVDGTTITGSYYSSNVPAGAIDLADGEMINTSLFEAVADTIVLENSGEYDILFAWCNDDSGGEQHPLCIKNLELKLIAESSVGTKMEEIMIGDEKAYKVIRNGHVYIIRRGHVFSILGQKMK